MTKTELQRAAVCLRREARVLRSSNIDETGQWTGVSQGIIDEHDEMVVLAKKLDRLARQPLKRKVRG
jgi:hypothetical protein